MFIKSGAKNNGRRRLTLGELAGAGQAIHDRHAHVHQDNIGVIFFNKGKRLLAMLGQTNQLIAADVFEKAH
jgi:hypothetical protein